jgi:hypothetical protein
MAESKRRSDLLVDRAISRGVQPAFAGSALSPVTIQTPSKPLFILSRIVGIEIDVYAGYSAIAKLEDVAETSFDQVPSRFICNFS